MTIGPGFEDVLVAAQAGAEWAVAALYRDLNPALLRYLQAQHRNAAEDIASEVWLAVASHLTTFEGDEDGFRGWIFTIAHRRAIDYGRQQSRRRTEPVDTTELAARAGNADTADEGIAGISSRQAVAHLTAGLPPDQAEVVILRVVGGFDVAEVAEIMGRSAGSVRVLQHRALRRLARRLAPAKEGVTP